MSIGKLQNYTYLDLKKDLWNRVNMCWQWQVGVLTSLPRTHCFSIKYENGYVSNISSIITECHHRLNYIINCMPKMASARFLEPNRISLKSNHPLVGRIFLGTSGFREDKVVHQPVEPLLSSYFKRAKDFKVLN